MTSTSDSHNYEDKIEEMPKIIKGLSSKLDKMEIEGMNANKPIQDGGNRNPNQFRRNFNLQQILQRDMKDNEDTKVQPPFQNNLFDEVEEQEIDTEEKK